MADDPFEPPVPAPPLRLLRFCVSCSDELPSRHAMRCAACIDAAWQAISAAAGRTVSPSDVARYRR